MALFALADPHLGIGVDKPMHIFGQHWHLHEQMIRENWLNTVSHDDTVLIPGDISWAMHLHEVIPDLRFLDQLPGQKILLRGNHDYWWSSLAKLKTLCEQENFTRIQFLRNNGLFVPPRDIVCGTRGWILPDDQDFMESDLKIYQRELGRLEMSLQAADKIRKEGQRLVVCLHFPPFGRTVRANQLTEMISQYKADLCVYGHIHGEISRLPQSVQLGAVDYILVSADALGFKPLRL